MHPGRKTCPYKDAVIFINNIKDPGGLFSLQGLYSIGQSRIIMYGYGAHCNNVPALLQMKDIIVPEFKTDVTPP